MLKQRYYFVPRELGQWRGMKSVQALQGEITVYELRFRGKKLAKVVKRASGFFTALAVRIKSLIK
jgi:hypothetical protein